MKEISRQLVHLSGILFILLAQFTEKSTASIYFFLIALTFLIYSIYIMRETSRLKKFVHFFESRLREKVMKIERPGIPMQGAFWFYFACGLSFLIFPKEIATAACLILAVSDSLSTLVGKHLGTRKILGTKTLEGTLVFFFSSLIIALAFSPSAALAVALAATAGELLPELAPSLKRRAILDDNLTIPILAGIAFLLF